jgi:enoyl-CoA hydratase/carnithine racemase
MTEAPHLLVSEEGAILIATLNRPEKLNAIDQEIMDGLEEAVARLRDTPQFKVLLIRATGRYFSAGADLMQPPKGVAAMPMNTGSAIREMHRRKPDKMRQVWDEMEHVEKPIVVAHQGPCVGGGLEMSLSCDFRLAAESASYAFPEGKFGVLPATNGVSTLTRIVGPHWARYLIMANRKADARRAYVMGLVHEVFPDESFEEDVMEFCRHLAKQHSEQMGTAKIAIELAQDLGLGQARHVERMANSALMLAPDYAEGMRRHLETVGKGLGG